MRNAAIPFSGGSLKAKSHSFLRNIVSFIKRLKYMIAVVLATGCYAGILYNQTMPFAEGWYTYYAQCINNGEVVYRDFDYLFTPLYINLIAFITKIFGYKIIVLRFIGIIFFCAIAVIVFLVLKEMFKESTACIAAITAAFYLQSEIVQVFYDYVRLMDIFACLTTLFLVKAVKKLNDSSEKSSLRFFCLAGLSNSCFYLIKQNMGLLFAVYAIILVFAASFVLRKKIKQIGKYEVVFLAGFLLPIIFTYASMAVSGSLSSYMHLTGAEAIAAKGGVLAILFGWLYNNFWAFAGGAKWALVSLFVIAGAYTLKTKIFTEKSRYANQVSNVGALVFTALVIGMCIVFTRSESIARRVTERYPVLSPYTIFLVVVPLFLFFVVHVLTLYVKKGSIQEQELLYITMSGAYLAISYGCGMSGGLAEGQATLGLAFMISLLLNNLDFKYSDILTATLIMVCLINTLQSAEKKMVSTYNWWGMDESNYWSSRKTSDDIELLSGIGMSPETLNAYETIYHVITEKTQPGEPIYCFPQIPIFYSLCDRPDPGVRAKVQWFDVVSDATIESDKQVLEKNPPKAILIYDTSEYAYENHERAFRKGQISATRKMKNFLLEFAQKYGYTFYGRISSTSNNSFLLFYKEGSDYSEKDFTFDGNGTAESPYLINNANDLIKLSKQVSNGQSFLNVYFKQTRDIDFSGVRNWEPIGDAENKIAFCGIYDGAGHTISNLRYISKTQPAGFFELLGGTVCNLGIVDSYFSGVNTGIISVYAKDNNARIVNCYTDSFAAGYRAGTLVDDFCGTMINCFSVSGAHGIEVAGAISLNGPSLTNVYSTIDDISSEILNHATVSDVKYCSQEFLGSDYVLDSMNWMVDAINDTSKMYNETGALFNANYGISYEPWMENIKLFSWDISENGAYPQLSKYSPPLKHQY